MINTEWDILLKDEYNKDYFKSLLHFVDNEYKIKKVWPEYNYIFRALSMVDYSKVKVVLIGQDPYHGENEANGLAFSVNSDVKIPPSLRNIFKELKNDLGIIRVDTDLSDWAKQGVLLINSCLTVVQDTPLSHSNIGWEIFTDEIVKLLGKRENPIIFILLGNYAKSKKAYIGANHFIIEAAHPSPLSASRGFFDSKIFSKTNNYLKEINGKEIEW